MDLTELEREARTLLDLHGLTEWEFGFDRAIQRVGQCNHWTRRITVSRTTAAAWPREEMIDTVLHEIAHALVGPSHGHDDVWRAKAVEVGARPESRVTVGDLPDVRPYQGTCPAGHTIRRARRIRNISCSRCSTSYSAAHVFTWEKVL